MQLNDYFKLISLFSISCTIEAVPVAYVDQAAFLNDLATLGHAAVHEGFESDTVWGGVRSSIVDGNHTAPEITSRGVTWTSNHTGNGVTTSEGAARSGTYGFYSLPHGAYSSPGSLDCSIPGECGDGFIGTTAAGTLFGVGGWFRTNTPYAKLGMFLGSYPDNPVDFGETCDSSGQNCVGNSTLGTAYEFFGVIDPDGFSQFEYRELEGTSGDAKLIFADDFRIAGSATVVPLPPALGLFGAGLLGLFGVRRRRPGQAQGAA